MYWVRIQTTWYANPCAHTNTHAATSLMPIQTITTTATTTTMAVLQANSKTQRDTITILKVRVKSSISWEVYVGEVGSKYP